MTRPNPSGRVQAAVRAALPPLLPPQIPRSIGSVAMRQRDATAGRTSSSRKPGVAVVEGVVLGVAVLGRHPVDVDHTGVDEHADHRRHVAGRGEVVQHGPAPDGAVGVEVPPAVVEHHDGALDIRGMAGGSMHPHRPHGAGEPVARVEPELLDRAGRHVGPGLGIGPVRVRHVMLRDREMSERHRRGHGPTVPSGRGSGAVTDWRPGAGEPISSPAPGLQSGPLRTQRRRVSRG